MTATLTQVVKQFQQDWTAQLEPNAILTACRAAAYRWRERILDPVTTTQLFFVQMLHGNTACTHLRHLTKLNVTASADCQARMKLPLTVFQQLLRSVSDAVQPAALEQGRWLGHRTFWVDGSSFSMPATPALQKHCGQPGKQLPGCGFPVAHLLAMFHAGTGLVLQILAAPLRTHDLSEVVGLHPELRPGDVVVADRGFCSYAHLALLVQAGVHAVFRMHQPHLVDFTPGRPHGEPRTRGKGHKGQPRSAWLQQLGEHDQRVHGLKPLAGPQWMDEEQFGHLPERLEVRELQYRVHRKGFRVTKIPLVTTLLEATLYPVEALAQLYYARWGIATNFAHVKTTMGLDVLKCKTVDGGLKELIVFALIYNLIRLVMLQAARRHQVDIDRISFIDAARWLAAARDNEPLSLLVVNPHRPSRYEPRVRKRRPTQYPLMQTPRKELRMLLANNVNVD
jgi:Transposase DDE domain